MLLSLHVELVSRIALHLLASQPFTPPYALNSLHLTCKSLHRLLMSEHFKGMAFGVCFDVSSVGRRNFVANTGMRADQFEVWGRIVHWISERNVDVGDHKPGDHAPFTLLTTHPWDIGETFLQAYIMLLSNDGKNLAQLEHAGLYSLLRAYLKKYLYKEELLDNGWPVESLENSCALWLLWMMMTEERLSEESQEEKEELVSMVLPWVMVSFRYSAAHAPPSHYTLPLSPTLTPSHPADQPGRRRPSPSYNLPHSVMTTHGPYPIYGPTVLPSTTSPREIRDLPYTPAHYLNVSYFGTRCIFSAPPPSMAAKMLYFSRRSTGFVIPSHLPATRVESIRLAREAWEGEQREKGLVIGKNGVVWDGRMRVGPTKEDIIDVNAHQSTELPIRTSWYDDWDGDALSTPPSRRWDNDYYRSRHCYDAFLEKDRGSGDVYTPGMLDGLWQGRILVLCERRLRSLLTVPRLPVDPNAKIEGQPDYLPEEYLITSSGPLIMRLGEYHWLDGSKRRRDRTRSTEQPLGDRLAALDEEATEPGGIARCAMRVNRIDEGMGNAWFPLGSDFVVDNDAVKVKTPPANLAASSWQQAGNAVSSLYERFHATEPNSHDPEYCAECLKREAERQMMRRAVGAENVAAMRSRELSAPAVGSPIGKGKGKAILDGTPNDIPHNISMGDKEAEETTILRDHLGDDGVESIFESVGLGHTWRRQHGDSTIPGVDSRRNIGEVEMDGEDEEDGEDWMDVDSKNDEDDVSCWSSEDTDLPAGNPLIAPPCHGVRDILVYGSSDPLHSLAWHPFVFRGRVRPWDGLVGILRVCKDGAFSDAFFYGYVVGGKNFVGSWRDVGTKLNAGVSAWEGAFSMSKRE